MHKVRNRGGPHDRIGPRWPINVDKRRAGPGRARASRRRHHSRVVVR